MDAFLTLVPTGDMDAHFVVRYALHLGKGYVMEMASVAHIITVFLPKTAGQEIHAPKISVDLTATRESALRSFFAAQVVLRGVLGTISRDGEERGGV
ncbi:hypothetical protein RB195_022140 [Necator americanus]|uniref:Uncharacterized protein n=1 Tax=Necator americanus TaxID=51031 RepID=A0ABR1EES4_NECAM